MRSLFVTALFLLSLLVPCANAYLLTISDQPNDDGTRLLVRWAKLPPPDLTDINPETYKLERSIYPDSGFITVGSISRVDTTFRTVDSWSQNRPGILLQARLSRFADRLEFIGVWPDCPPRKLVQ